MGKGRGGKGGSGGNNVTKIVVVREGERRRKIILRRGSWRLVKGEEGRKRKRGKEVRQEWRDQRESGYES